MTTIMVNNMEQNLREFINEMFEKLNDEYSNLGEKQLINDIIYIYEGIYTDYEYYKNSIIKLNRLIDERNNVKPYNTCFKVVMQFQPKHTVLSENIFNFIRELSKEYEKDK